MASSASAIADGFLALFGAASQFGTTGVSKNSYQVLESVSGSCLVISCVGLNSSFMTLGGDRRYHWTFRLKYWIRDTGDAVATINRTWTVIDNIISALASDPTVQGTAQEIQTIQATRDPESAEVVGGHAWLPIIYDVEVVDWD